jgi:DNA invertase Pin-like site-specific DNA recombinase
MARYGYILLDRQDPDISRQAQQLDSIGDFSRIFIDQATADAPTAEPARAQRQRLIGLLEKGDVVYCAALDRWCDNLKDFLDQNQAVDRAGADLCILGDPFDSRSQAGRQAVKLLRGFARLEHHFQSSRKKAGIALARQNGRRIGRPLAAIPPGFRKICKEWSEGLINSKEAAQRSGMGSTSFYKKAGELGFQAPGRRHGADGKTSL